MVFEIKGDRYNKKEGFTKREDIEKCPPPPKKCAKNRLKMKNYKILSLQTCMNRGFARWRANKNEGLCKPLWDKGL